MPDYPPVRLVFGKERSRHYEDVVAQCRRLGKKSGNDYLRSGEGHNIKHIFRASDPRIAGKVWDRVRPWNSVKIYIDDRPATVAEFKTLRRKAVAQRRKWWLAAAILAGVGTIVYLIV